MEKQNEIKVFEDKQVRSVWDAEQEKWYFSIIDVIEVLTESPRPRKYWNALKTKLKAEGSQLSQNVGQLKMPTQFQIPARSQILALGAMAGEIREIV
jgi:hypothetical protein